MSLSSSKTAWQLSKTGSIAWNSKLRDTADGLASAAAGHDDATIAAALDRAVRADLTLFLEGLQRYRTAPQRRPRKSTAWPAPELVWEAGTARLFAYGDAESAPVLLVPSLVNRSYVLDLMKGRSLVRFLAKEGFRPLLLDWGNPNLRERAFTIDDYVTERLLPAFDHSVHLARNQPIPVVGYCMGGLFTLAAAQQRGDQVAGMALLATPWNFHAERPAEAKALSALVAGWLPALQTVGVLPVDALQTLFALNDPWLAHRKFSAFAGLDPESDDAAHFVALEDWVNDGVALPLEVARTCFIDWYGGNTTHGGGWRVLSEPVDPRRLTQPAAVFVPSGDRIVPAGSALALANALPNGTTVTVPGGHIGMVTGRRGRQGLWQPLADWLETLSAAKP